MPAARRRSPMRTSCSRRNEGPGCGRRSGTRPRIPGGRAAAVEAGARVRRPAVAGVGGRGGVAGRPAEPAGGDGAPAGALRPRPRPRRPRVGPPRPRRVASAPPSCDSGIPCSTTTSALSATVSASRSARSASIWRRSISRRTARRAAGERPRRWPAASVLGGRLAGDERQEPVARAGDLGRARGSPRVERGDALDVGSAAGAAASAWRRTTGSARRAGRAAAAEHHGQRVSGRSSDRPCAHSTRSDPRCQTPPIRPASVTPTRSWPAACC